MSDLKINLKDGVAEIIRDPATDTPKTETPVAELGMSFKGITSFDPLGIPIGSGVISGFWGDLITGAVDKFIPASLLGGLGTNAGTVTKLGAAWLSAWGGKKIKFIGQQVGRDAALVIVANTARTYTKPIVDSILGFIPAPAASMQQGAASMAQQHANQYQAANPFSPYGGK